MREEIGSHKESSVQWKEAMERSFARMDKEVQEWSDVAKTSNCRCELQTLQCDAVGSTAVVAIVTPDKIIVSNCGDSRAVLCRNGVATPLSSDHKVSLTGTAKSAKHLRCSRWAGGAWISHALLTSFSLLYDSRIGQTSWSGSKTPVAGSSTGTERAF